MVLVVKYRFTEFPYIVVDPHGVFYQLPHCDNKYTKNFRKLKLTLNNGVTAGYRINRKFVSLKQLRELAYKTTETITVKSAEIEVPF